MYISDEIFTWAFDRGGVKSWFDEDYVSRAYEIWHHAKNRIKGTPTNDDRADCITSLKKSVDSRLKAIRAAYCFDDLPNLGRNKKQLEKMELYGLIRRTVIKELFDLRNIIEHKDTIPPDLDKCYSYIDIVWYFLKSTDDLLDMREEFLEYNEKNNNLNIYFYPCEKWRVKIEGNIENQYLSYENKDGYIQLTNYESEPWNDRTMLVRFSGTPVLDEKLTIQFAHEYFSGLGYYYEDHA